MLMAAVDRRASAIRNVARQPTAGERAGGCNSSRRRMNLKSSADAGRRSYQPALPAGAERLGLPGDCETVR